MSPNLNTRSAVLNSDIRRVRTRTHANGAVELHVTYSSGRRLHVPANGRYAARHSYGVEPVR